MRLVYSSRVVRPEMRIGSELRATAARDILDEILAPHDLGARPTADGLLVVVPAEGTGASDVGSLSGLVLDGHGAPLAGVRILLKGTALSTASDPAGTFEFRALPAGDYLVEAGAAGYTIARGRPL